ncbi:MAG: sigma-70 family RNA polymerase sigma factor [Planctomycetota bacterium]
MDQNPQPAASDPATWLDQYGDYLYRFALSRLRDGDAAEEAVQETFVAALRNKEQFSGKGSERGWLMGILKRKIIDFYRKRQRDPVNLDEESGSISDMLFDKGGHWKKEVRGFIAKSLDSLEVKEFRSILQKCLALLPSRQADAFTMRTMDDREADDICKELDISSSNYWVILHRARLRLASCIKQNWFQAGENV